MKQYNIFHRVTSLLCAAALLLGMCAVPVAAADTLRVTAATGTTIQQGSTGECSVYIDSTKSLASLTVTVHFDPTQVRITELNNSVDCLLQDSNQDADHIQFSYIFNGEGQEAKTRLFYFRYQVLSDADTGAAFFDITVSDAYDSGLNAVAVTGSRCYFNIAEAVNVKRCSVTVDKTGVSTLVAEEFSLSYRFNTPEIASGFATIAYDPELFEVVDVANGAFLNDKVVDVNADMPGIIYLSFVGLSYGSARDLATVTFRTIKNEARKSSISFTATELYDAGLNTILCSGVSSAVEIAYDPEYTGDAPTMKVTAEYDSATEQVTAEINLEEMSKLGAGDFAVEFDPAVLTLTGYEKGFSPTYFLINDKQADKGILKFSIISMQDIVKAEKVLTLVFDVHYACVDQETELDLRGSMLSDSMLNPVILNFRDGKVTVPLRHYIGDWVIDPAPTCTETGLNVRKCTVCGLVMETGDVIPANGHSPVVDEAVEQDCGNTGLTEGSHCSVCDEILVAQQVIPANGHTAGEIVVENAFDPDCTNVGGYENVVYCTVCNAELSREAMVVDPLGHTEVIDKAVAHTCREDGLTEGKHCSVCNEILIAQNVVPAAHDLDENGLCRRCSQYAGTCGTSAKWELNAEGVLTIYGTGAMSEFYTVSSYQPWYSRREEIKKVVIEDGITVIGRNAFNGCANLTEAVIPDSVKQINYQAFHGCAGLITVDIPDSVTVMESGVFYGCSGLDAIRLPAHLNAIEGNAFYNCTNLTRIELPEGVTSIGNNAFNSCSSLTEFRIPDAVTSIGSGVFSGCTGLTSVVIPAGVTSIGSYAFNYCSSLTEIRIPDAVTSIGSGAFYGCASLTSIVVPEGVTTVANDTFAHCSGLTEVEIPASVTSIGYEAFRNCSGLRELRIPDAVTSIGEGAFYGCTALTGIAIPEGVTAIANDTFELCSGLTEIEIPASVTSIGSEAFRNCSGLTEIRIPAAVTSIGNGAFYGCASLTGIVLPEGITAVSASLFGQCTSLVDVQIPAGVTEIGQSAFAYCSSLKNVEIPAAVTQIGNYAFQNCISLGEITLPEGLTTIGVYLFDGCKALTGIKIPESVTTINDYAFQNCSALKEITIPGAVKEIGIYAFAYCSQLKEVRFLGNAPVMGSRAFRNVVANAHYPYPDATWTDTAKQNYGGTIRWFSYCTGEHEVEVDEAVAPDCTNTGLTEGSHCALCDVVFVAQEIVPANGHTESEVVVENRVEPDCTNVGGYDNVIYCAVCNVELSRNHVVVDALGHTEVIDAAVPHTCRETGLTEGKHCSVCNEVLIAQQIIPDAHTLDENGLCQVCGKYAGNCGSGVKWEMDAEGTLTLYGKGSMGYYFSTESLPWYAHWESINKVVVEAGVTSVGGSVFADCATLTQVQMADTVTAILGSAFYNCPNLETVEFSRNLTTIHDYAFYGCIALTEISLPESVASVGGNAFAECSNLKKVQLPESSCALGVGAFQNCASLTEINLPGDLKTLPAYVLSGCINLAEVHIPETVTSIGSSAFNGCTNLIRIDLPEGVTKIENGAFKNCTDLIAVDIPEGVTQIGYQAFMNCASLAEVNLPAGITELEFDVFNGCTSLKSVHIPEGVTLLENRAFSGCTSLEEVYIPSTVTLMENSVFRSCSGLTSVNLPHGLTCLESSVFNSCSGLTSITIPASVTEIGSYAFAWAYGLKEIRFLGDVPTIHSSAFTGANADAWYPVGNETWTEEVLGSYGGSLTWKTYCTGDHSPVVDEAVAPDCTNTGLTEGSHCANCDVILVPQEVIPANGHTDGEVVVENRVEPDCTNDGGYDNVVYCTVCEAELRRDHVVLDAWGHTEGEVVVENRVEPNCTNDGGYDNVVYCTVCEAELRRDRVVLDAWGHTEGEVVVENRAEPDCTNDGGYDNVVYCSVCEAELRRDHVVLDAWGHTEGEIVVENAVDPTCTKDGGYDNVVYCTVCDQELSREHVVIDALGHTEVVDAAVAPTCRETGLTEGKHCSVCNKVLVAQQIIPDAHALDENGVCQVCGRYAGTWGYNVKWDLDADGLLTFYGTGSMSSTWTLEEIPWYPYLESIKKAVVCEGVTNVGASTFYNCVNLTEVSLPSSLRTIDWQSFVNCTSLTELVIPESVVAIYSYAFSGCSDLTRVNIPTGVTNIESGVFTGCSALTELDLPDGVTTIGSSAFQNCSSLETIRIPDGVTYIGSYAFYNCSSLKQVTIPAGVTSIEYGTFQNCSSLTSIAIPDAVTVIGSSAFSGCSALTEIAIPVGVTSIESSTFQNCSSLTSVAIPDTVTVIGSSAFYGCSALTEIAIPAGVTRIGYYAFQNCSSLRSVAIPVGVTVLENYTFSGCSSLTSIRIPDSVTKIEYYVFQNCNALSLVFYPGTENQRNEITIWSGNTLLTNAIWHYEVVETMLDGSLAYWCPECSRYYRPDGTKAAMQLVELLTLPDKLRYYTSDSLDLDGIAMTGSYSNGMQLSLGKEDVESISVDLTTPGRKTAVITVMGIPLTFEVIVHDDGRVLADPALYPESEHPYTDNLNDTQTFTYPGAKHLEITFNAQTLVENNYDFIYIYDGQEELLVKYTNDAAANQTVVIPGDTFTVQLTTDVSATRYGYAFEKIIADFETGIQHDVVVDPATVTCTEAGLTEGVHCGICGDVLVAQEQVAALGHDWTQGAVLNAATCTETGLRQIICARCGHVDTEEIPAKGHAEVIDKAVTPDCVNTGLTEGKHCSVCGETLVAQQTVPAKGHTDVIDKAVDPDCTNTGLTEGKHCSVCGETLIAQQAVPAKGHTEVIDKAVAPDCTETGLTEGKHCSVCDEVLVAQQTVPAKGHTDVIDKAVEPDCVNTGLTEGKHCSVCDEVLVAQQTVPAKGHTDVIDKAVEPDCVNTGLSEGKHCSVCDEVLIAQKVVPAKGHTDVIDKAVEPDCVNTGLTEGKHCSVCNEVLVKQEVVPATGHGMEEVLYVAPTFDAPGAMGHYRCETCGLLFADLEGLRPLTPEETILAQLVAETVINGVRYESLTEALAAAQPGDEVKLLKDTVVEDYLIVPNGVDLNLGDCDLTAQYLFASKDSCIVANPNSGKLIVEKGNLLLGQQGYVNAAGQYVMPIWDPAQGCYIFSLFVVNTDTAKGRGLRIDEEKEVIYFQFKHQATSALNSRLLSDGASDNELSVIIRLSWTNAQGTAYQDFVYNDGQVAKVTGSFDYTFTLTGYSALNINLSTLVVQAMIVTNSGATAFGTAWTQNMLK